MSKNFFYRIEPNEVLSEILGVPEAERSNWYTQFFQDLRKGDPGLATTEFAASIINEANGFRERKARAGSLGGLAKRSSAKQC